MLGRLRFRSLRWLGGSLLGIFTFLTSNRATAKMVGLPTNALEISLTVQHVEHGGAAHPVVLIQLTNRASVPLAVSNTFGFGSHAWFGLRIRDEKGNPIQYPADVDIFGTPPTYRCLAAGATLTRRVDLLDWRLQTDDRDLLEEHFGFALAPGRYEIQALYSDVPRELDLECLVFRGVARSGWQELRVSG